MPRSLEPREKRTIALGGVAAAAILTYAFWPSATPESGVELVQPTVPVQAPAPTPVPAAPPAATPVAAAPAVEGLRLFGLMGGGAIIGQGEGAQRFVALGRDVQPGLTLIAVEQHAAVLRSAAGDIRIGFAGPIQPVDSNAAPPAAQAQPSEASARADTLRYRMGLAPRREGGRVVGHTVRSGADLPVLARAGIQPGDTILSVNGSVLNEERVSELAWEIANSTRTEFEIERGGRRVRLVHQNTGS